MCTVGDTSFKPVSFGNAAVAVEVDGTIIVSMRHRDTCCRSSSNNERGAAGDDVGNSCEVCDSQRHATCAATGWEACVPTLSPCARPQERANAVPPAAPHVYGNRSLFVKGSRDSYHPAVPAPGMALGVPLAEWWGRQRISRVLRSASPNEWGKTYGGRGRSRSDNERGGYQGENGKVRSFGRS